MKIESLRDLKKLIELCQKTGIEEISLDGIQLKLSAYTYTKPSKKESQKNTAPKAIIAPGGITDETKIVDEGLTDEELLFWSTGENESQESLS